MQELSREVSVDEMQYGGLFMIQDGDMLVVAGAPDWVRHPITGEKIYIESRWVADEDITCPSCKAVGRHGLINTKTDIIILCCRACKKFVWIQVKEAKDK